MEILNITASELIEKLSLPYKEHTEWRKGIGQNCLLIQDETLEKTSIKNLQGAKNLKFINVLFLNSEISSTTFSNVVFKNVKFIHCNFSNVRFEKCHFEELDLSQSKGSDLKFSECELKKSELFDNSIAKITYDSCRFENIDISKPNALKLDFSKITFDAHSKKHAKKNSRITFGLNGIYNTANGSASISHFVPSGDSMTGDDENVILESLMKAKKSVSTALTTVLVLFTLKYIGLSSLAFLGLSINPSAFLIIALPIILSSLYKGNILLGDAILNVRYVKTQSGAMRIGRFPWLVSRFGGNGLKNKLESTLIRSFYCALPIILLPIILEISNSNIFANNVYGMSISQNLCRFYLKHNNIILICIWITYLAIIFFCFKLFLKSQSLQKPILFNLKVDTIYQLPNDHRIAESLEKLNHNLENYFRKEDPLYNSSFGFTNKNKFDGK